MQRSKTKYETSLRSAFGGIPVQTSNGVGQALWRRSYVKVPHDCKAKAKSFTLGVLSLRCPAAAVSGKFFET